MLSYKYVVFCYSVIFHEVFLKCQIMVHVSYALQAVEEGSAAKQAGLKVDDIVTHINGKCIEGLQHIKVVPLIMSTSNKLALRIIPLTQTSIKSGGPKHGPFMGAMLKHGFAGLSNKKSPSRGKELIYKCRDLESCLKSHVPLHRYRSADLYSKIPSKLGSAMFIEANTGTYVHSCHSNSECGSIATRKPKIQLSRSLSLSDKDGRFSLSRKGSVTKSPNVTDCANKSCSNLSRNNKTKSPKLNIDRAMKISIPDARISQCKSNPVSPLPNSPRSCNRSSPFVNLFTSESSDSSSGLASPICNVNDASFVRPSALEVRLIQQLHPSPKHGPRRRSVQPVSPLVRDAVSPIYRDAPVILGPISTSTHSMGISKTTQSFSPRRRSSIEPPIVHDTAKQFTQKNINHHNTIMLQRSWSPESFKKIENNNSNSNNNNENKN